MEDKIKVVTPLCEGCDSEKEQACCTFCPKCGGRRCYKRNNGATCNYCDREG